MKRLLCRAALTALTLAPAALAQQSGEIVPGPRPPYRAFSPPSAVDHVALLVVTPAGGPKRTELVTLKRAGDLQREDVRRDGASSSDFSDFGRGVSVKWTHRDDGGEYLQAYQDAPESSGSYIREHTGELQRWAGETCEVWSWRLVEPKSYSSTSLRCVTHDGIELWQGHRGYDGTITETFHAMLVERRTVQPEEVRLPPEALDWTRWRAGATAGDIKAGYEVTLSGDGNPDYVDRIGGDEVVMKLRGDWRLTDTHVSRGGHSLDISHKRVSLNFSENRYGRNLSLGLHVSPPEVITGDPVAYTPRREDTILGRQCTWYNTMPNWHDVGAGACRDADGVTLALFHESRGHVTMSVRATRFSDAPAPEKAFTPPAGIFAWITG